MLLPPVDRQFDTPTSQEENAAARGPRRIPWLECLLLVGGIALVLQLYPPAASWALTVIDVRQWTWGTWVAAEIVIIAVLGGLALWRRR
jgi:hypothetical protein